MAMRALITGGAGFIGSNLTQALLERGDDVAVLDNFATGRRENLAPFLDDIELIEGDLRSYERVHYAVRGREVIFHHAALPSVPRSVQDPLTSSEVNVGGTLNILLAARDEGARRVIFASSSSIYGDGPGMPRVESMPPHPLAPYPVSKMAAEQYCRVASSVYGLETLSLRYFNIFGRRQDPFSEYSAVIPLFIAKILEGKSPRIFGDGEQARDFTHIDNVIDANLRCADIPKANGEVMNIACGEMYSVNDLARNLIELCGADVQPEYAPPRAGDVKDSCADITRAREVLGYELLVGFLEGLKLTLDSFDETAAQALIKS